MWMRDREYIEYKTFADVKRVTGFDKCKWFG